MSHFLPSKPFLPLLTEIKTTLTCPVPVLRYLGSQSEPPLEGKHLFTMEGKHHAEAHGNAQGVARLIFATFLEDFLLFPTDFSLGTTCGLQGGQGVSSSYSEKVSLLLYLLCTSVYKTV